MLDPNQPSISFEQVTNMLKEIEQTHSKIMSNTEAYRIQYRMLESSYFGLHSKLGLAQADREFGRAVDSVVNTVVKIRAVLPLAALLDSHRGGDHLGVGHEHNFQPSQLRKKKGKKRGLSR